MKNTAAQPSAMYIGVESQRGASIQKIRKNIPASAAAQMTDSSTTLDEPSRKRKANGVYEPAISTKMFAWSIRRRNAQTLGDHVPRWYTPDVVNSRRALAANTAAPTRVAGVG